MSEHIVFRMCAAQENYDIIHCEPEKKPHIMCANEIVVYYHNVRIHIYGLYCTLLGNTARWQSFGSPRHADSVGVAHTSSGPNNWLTLSFACDTFCWVILTLVNHTSQPLGHVSAVGIRHSVSTHVYIYIFITLHDIIYSPPWKWSIAMAVASVQRG